MSFLVTALVSLILVGPSDQSTVTAIDTVVPVAAATVPPPQPDRDSTPQDKIEPLSDKPPTPAHTGSHAILVGLRGDIKHLPSMPNLYIAIVGGGLALGTHPFDDTVNARLISHYDVVNKIFAPAKYYGATTEQVALSVGTWAIGRVMHKPRMSHLGMDLLRAQAVTELLVQPVKFATHRQRPDASNRQSFPSGHAAVTFATAAVLERHLGWRRSLVAYGIASYVAASRLHDNRHYLSDVVFGAAVGSIAGRTVTAHGRNVWTLGPAAIPGGIALAVTRTGF